MSRFQTFLLDHLGNPRSSYLAGLFCQTHSCMCMFVLSGYSFSIGRHGTFYDRSQSRPIAKQTLWDTTLIVVLFHKKTVLWSKLHTNWWKWSFMSSFMSANGISNLKCIHSSLVSRQCHGPTLLQLDSLFLSVRVLCPSTLSNWSALSLLGIDILSNRERAKPFQFGSNDHLCDLYVV